jgi:cell division protein FtsI (penicillin-binding protein 3)
MMAIGYEIQQTPLQTLAFYNAVANNGKFLRPQFVEEIRRSGQTIKKFEPYVLNEKISLFSKYLFIFSTYKSS